MISVDGEMEDPPKDDEDEDEELEDEEGGDMPKSGENRFFMQTCFLSLLKSLETPAPRFELVERRVCITF